MPKAEIEILSGVVRFWNDSDAGYGDPYDWVATLRWVNPEVAEVVGITKPPTPDTWRAVKEAAAKAGVKKLIFYRIKNGKKLLKELTLC